jgi:peptidyl-tRNA hydrolase, PTH1 family
MKLIVGLGNPGSEYDGTRHNVGFEVIDLLARRHNISVSKRNFKSVYGEGIIEGEKVLLVRPMTYMNLSGEAVGAIARFYKLEPTDVWVILDEVALPPGRIRLRFKGSAGGHNGMSNIITMLHTQDVPRIRLGVGSAKSGSAMVGHVLGKFRKEESPLIEEAVERSADAIECAIKEGFEMAMNRFNLPDKPPVEKSPRPESS